MTIPELTILSLSLPTVIVIVIVSPSDGCTHVMIYPIICLRVVPVIDRSAVSAFVYRTASAVGTNQSSRSHLPALRWISLLESVDLRLTT